MNKKRIVITGVGVVSCFGNDVETFFQSLLAGKSGAKTIDHFDVTNYPTNFGCSIDGFDPSGYMDPKMVRRLDPFIQYAMVAGKKAFEMANLEGQFDENRSGVLVGSGMGGMQTFFDGSVTLHEQSYRRLSPFFIPAIITNMAGGLLAMDLNFKGPNYSIATACATANYCIVNAANHIRQGHADVMLCGGTEAAITDLGLSSFIACKALSKRNEDPTKASRPWDRDRDGFVMGEGAGVLVLETLEHAQKRGAKILAEYKGGYLNCDAYHMTNPKPDGSGQAECVKQALKDAEVSISDVNYINAHGTSTPAGDGPEIYGLQSVFNEHLNNVAINSTKSMIGHCLGAAGALEGIAVIQSIREGKLHPTINLDNVDEDLKQFNFVANEAQEMDIEIALSNSFGFGGHNSCIVLGKYHGN